MCGVINIMKTNGYQRDAHLIEILKGILREINESLDSCKNDESVHRHHRVAAKNIEINMLEVQPMIANKTVLRTLYLRATEDLARLNRMLHRSRDKSGIEGSRMNDKVLMEEELQDQIKENRELKAELKQLREKVRVLEKEKSTLSGKAKQYEYQSEKTAEGLIGISEQLKLQQEEYDEKWILATTEIKQLRRELQQTLTRNQNLVKQCNELQLQNYKLTRQKTHYQHQMETLLTRIDSEIDVINERIAYNSNEFDGTRKKSEKKIGFALTEQSLDDRLEKFEKQQTIKKDQIEKKESANLQGLRQEVRKLKDQLFSTQKKA